MSTLVESHEISPGALPEPAYYVLDFAKVSFRELWRLLRQRVVSVRFAFQVLIAKLFHRSLRAGIPLLLDNIEIVQLQDIPAQVRCDIQPLIESLQSAGFKQLFGVREALAKGIGGYSVAFISSDRLCWAEITAIHKRDDRIGWERTVHIYTRRQNGRALCTADSKPRTYSHIDLQVVPESGVEQLLALHQRRLLDCADAETVTDVDLRDMVKCGSESVDGYKSLTHAFVPATAEEVERFRNKAAVRGDFSTLTKSTN